MSEKGKTFFMVWGFWTAILFALCAFSQYTIELDEWTTTCRAIFGIGEVGILIAAWIDYDKN